MNPFDTDLPGVIRYQVATTSSGTYDAIIVGGGHNGLVAAAFLAKAGRRVLVLEAREVVGGLCWSREMTNAPGYQVSPCSLEFLLTGVKPSVIDQLNLAKYGLKWVYPTTLTTGLFPDGSYMPFYKDLSKTVEHIRRFSRRDAVKYEQLVGQITATLSAAMPYFQGHPFRVRPAMLAQTMKHLAKGRKDVARGARVFLNSIESVLEENFEREEVKAPLGTYSLASWGPIAEPGSGVYMAVLTGIHQWGVRRPMGGSGQFTRALAACVVDHGGEIRVATPVRQIQVRGGRATGVELTNGEVIAAKQVIGAVDPYTLIERLVDPKEIPDDTHGEMRGMQVSRHGVYIFKSDMALSGRPTFPKLKGEVDDEVMSTLTLCPTLEHLRRSAYLGMTGDYDDNIPLTTIVPSISDRSLVPPGSGGDTLYMYAFNTPIKLSGGRDWETESELYVKRAMAVFDSYAPGTSDMVLDRYDTSPPEFESRYHVYKGNYSHADLSLAQLGPWRPTPSLAAYRTPVKGLWHSGSGAFPMSYLSGWPGRNTAREVDRALAKSE
ncbi:phytoene desaturase family protein [Sporichthya polymorpha]|uniref:phytoene desaturase family protein n=1 Tax=Sporichthya polymorpha TaxID=35751 RepID=UPI00036DB4FF|nr:NAD(P)/FAD-dependent oxidoreductase [Sporichthya polymorpha]